MGSDAQYECVGGPFDGGWRYGEPGASLAQIIVAVRRSADPLRAEHVECSVPPPGVEGALFRMVGRYVLVGENTEPFGFRHRYHWQPGAISQSTGNAPEWKEKDPEPEDPERL